MNNLTTREKAMAFGILLILIIFLVYFFGIRILNDKYKEYQTQLKTLQDRKAFLDELKAENEKTQEEIKLLKANIEKIELSFIDKLETEVIEQYLMAEFEKNECPYLTEVQVKDVTTSPIVMADGKTSDNSVLRRSVEITYSTTDGFLPTQYNATPTFMVDGKPDYKAYEDMLALIGSADFTQFDGYDGFIKTLKDIEKKNKDCVKLVGIKAESQHGYMLLTATVDFFGATFTDRESTDTNKDAYTYWSGHTSIDTKGGFIGMPYIVTNENSAWRNVVIDMSEVKGFFARPFTPYVINAYFTKMIDKEGIRYVIGNMAGFNTGDSSEVNSDDYEQASQ
ncbi:MAG: hypothetical protein K5643_00750 [Saccharofermentans sp.]|nr:hypothetical protein [Saccharofermentans sp.]